jgi:hypothetical protein
MIGRVERVADKERWIAAFDGDRIVGTSGVFTMRLRVPGGELPTGGVTFVTVLPSHRRRGLMSGMMRLMIDDCHRAASRSRPCGRPRARSTSASGLGWRRCAMNLEAETRSVGIRPRVAARRLVPAVAGGRGAGSRGADLRSRPGAAARLPGPDAGLVGRRPAARREGRQGRRGAPARRLRDADGPEAYAVYKTKAEWNVRGPAATLTVEEAIGSTPAGRARSGGTCSKWTWSGRSRRGGCPPTTRSSARQRAAAAGHDRGRRAVAAHRRRGRPRWRAGPTASTAAAAAGLTLDLRDDYCPWNAGRWSLDVVGRTGARSPGRKPMRTWRSDANDLASLFLGGFTATALAGAGRVVELRPGSLAVADGLFPTALKPWCPQEF